MPCWLLMGILILENIFCVYGCFTTCVLCVSHACSGTMEPRELDLQTAMRTKPRDLVKKKKQQALSTRGYLHMCAMRQQTLSPMQIFTSSNFIFYLYQYYIMRHFPFYKKSSCLDNGSSSYGVSLQFSQHRIMRNRDL